MIPMEIHTAHAEPIGEFIREGHHKPFRALACQIGRSCKLAGQNAQAKQRWDRAAIIVAKSVLSGQSRLRAVSDKAESHQWASKATDVVVSIQILP